MPQQQLGINGFGRIGRSVFRIWWQNFRHQIDLQAINTSGSMELEDWIHLLRYDTNYGRFSPPIKIETEQSKDEVNDANPVLGKIVIGQDEDQKTITITAQRDPKKIPWSEFGVEIVLESTGVFRTEKQAAQHFKTGVKKVLISAPPKGGSVSSSVIGVNQFDPEGKVFSNASCTTNCVAPVTQIMHQTFTVEKAVMTTIHAYTSSQNILDNSHKDLRRGRTAGQNMVPTTTGAAVATTKIIPDLKQKFDGMAIRVPLAVGSLSDLVFVTEENTTVEAVNQAFIDATQEKRWQGVLAVTDEPIVSSDIVGRSESSIVDLNFTKVIGGNLIKVLSWYDNEWGYSHRLLEQILQLKD